MRYYTAGRDPLRANVYLLREDMAVIKDRGTGDLPEPGVDVTPLGVVALSKVNDLLSRERLLFPLLRDDPPERLEKDGAVRKRLRLEVKEGGRGTMGLLLLRDVGGKKRASAPKGMRGSSRHRSSSSSLSSSKRELRAVFRCCWRRACCCSIFQGAWESVSLSSSSSSNNERLAAACLRGSSMNCWTFVSSQQPLLVDESPYKRQSASSRLDCFCF